MAKFEDSIDFVLANEGGYQHDETDLSKGATKFGVTEATLIRWLGHHVSHEDVAAIDIDEAKKIYRALYWKPMLLDYCDNQAIATCLFDMAVNQGVEHAIKIGTLAIGDAGGVIPRLPCLLIESANSIKPDAYIKALSARCKHFYDQIVAKHPEQAKFKEGWYTRADKMLSLI